MPNTWTEIQRIDRMPAPPFPAGSFDDFGWDVDIDGDWLVVGTRFSESGRLGPSIFNDGVALVY